MTTTPRLGILMMATNMSNKEQVFNQAILTFDALFSGSVISASVTTPPASPSDGDTYIIPVGATGAWAGNTNNIAFSYNGWQIITPANEMRVYDTATAGFLLYTTAAGWTPVASGTPTNLTDLADVNAATPTNGQVLAFNTASGKWVPYTLPTYTPGPSTLQGLTDVSVTEGAGIDGKFLQFKQSTGKWVAVTLPTTMLSALSDVSVTEGVAIDGYLLSYNNLTAKWIAKAPATISVSTLNQIGDVSYGIYTETTIPPNAALVWSGSVWAPSTVAIKFTFEQMTDGPGTLVGAAGKALIVNPLETALEYADISTWISAANIHLSALSDVSVTEGVGIDGLFLKWNNATSKWVASTVASPLTVQSAGSTVDTATSLINFTGAGVTVTDTVAGHVHVDVSPPALAFQDHGAGILTPTTINFAGQATVSEAGGVLTLTVNGVTLLSNLSDVLVASPAVGDVLSWDIATSKWKNTSLATAVAALPNTMTAPTYEFGPFSPPTSVMFPVGYNATGIVNQSSAGRGLSSVPGSYGTTGYAFAGHVLSANIPPFTQSARVVVNAGSIAGYYGGIAMMRVETASLAFIGISPNSDGANTASITLNYWNGSAETVVASVKSDAKFLRLGFDGTNIKAWYSFDGIMWELLGAINNLVIGGIPDQLGVCHRVVNGVASNVSALYTYYDDPDYPYGARVTAAYGTLGLNELTNVSTAAPTDGQYLQWKAASSAWVPSNPPYKIGAFFTNTPLANEFLLIHAAATAFTLSGNFTSSVGWVGSNPAASFVMTVAKNGSAVGTITISTSGVLTFATTGGVAVSFAIGDVLTIEAPATPDTTIANGAVTLLGS